MTVWHYCHLQRLRGDLDMIQITVPESPSILSFKQKKTLDNQIVLLNVCHHFWLLHSVTSRGFSVAALENKMEDIKEYQKQ